MTKKNVIECNKRQNEKSGKETYTRFSKHAGCSVLVRMCVFECGKVQLYSVASNDETNV